jgi:threonine dehydratase
MNPHALPTPEDIPVAMARIRSLVKRTPILQSEVLDERLGLELIFKCEHLQKTGSFKLRGAMHAVSHLPDTCTGVATHSSGNHGAALALAAKLRGLTAEVVMPHNAIEAKVRAVKEHGGQVHFCEPTQQAREAGLSQWIKRGHMAIPPYDHPHIIQGQGTAALELIEQSPELDIIVAPIGGGGLISGTALAALNQPTKKRPRVIGVEPKGADDTYRSRLAGHRVSDHHPDTIADGLRAFVGEMNFALIQAHVDEVLCVTESQIIDAMTILMRDLKQVIEPSGAVPLAGVLAYRETFRGQRVGVILSGGNMNLPALIPTNG